jgi:hypothetical protein
LCVFSLDGVGDSKPFWDSYTLIFRLSLFIV